MTKLELETEITGLKEEIRHQHRWVARQRQSEAKHRGGREQQDLWKELEFQRHVLWRMRKDLESFELRLQYGEADPEAELLEDEVC